MDMLFRKLLVVVGAVVGWASWPSDSRAEEKREWASISEGAVSRTKPGWPGKTGGVVVDPRSGDVFLVVCDQGLWKSSDQGANFERVDDGKIGGRCETGFALDADPAGKRLMCFMIYGGSAFTDDSGKTWQASKSSHLDYGGVDWDATGRAFISIRHESGGVLTLTTDAGQTWKDSGKGFVQVGIFDAENLVATKGQGILHSADGGQTWTEASSRKPTGAVMRTFKGAGYWVSTEGILVSKDRGRTWDIPGTAVDAHLGPYFSDDPAHLVVVGKRGFHETRDAGATWELAAPLPEKFDVNRVGPNYAWDPKGDIFYASSMGKDTLRYRR
jgi:photosystem II stability/assembly factor-like uncharacterized protein